MIKQEHKDNIAVLQLYRPPANAIDIELCNALENAVKAEVESDSKANHPKPARGSFFPRGLIW